MALLAFFQSLLLHAPPGVFIVLTQVARGPNSCQAYVWQWYLFFSLLAFLLEVLLAGKEFDSFDAKSDIDFLTKLS